MPAADAEGPGTPREAFQYALLRVVPDLERGEYVNAGVVVFSRRHDYLGARVGLDAKRLRAIAPDADARRFDERLGALERIARGDSDAGTVAQLPASERFSWLVAPSSTSIQPSEVHTGLCTDPERLLDHLFERLVA